MPHDKSIQAVAWQPVQSTRQAAATTERMLAVAMDKKMAHLDRVWFDRSSERPQVKYEVRCPICHAALHCTALCCPALQH